jgi:septum site-determining protein MinC
MVLENQLRKRRRLAKIQRFCPQHFSLFMPIALTGRSCVTFDIKSANLSLLTMRLKSTNLGDLEADLASQYGDIPGFFDGDLLVIDLAYLPVNGSGLDFERLKSLLHGYRLRPVASTGGTPDLMAAALAAGLPATPLPGRDPRGILAKTKASKIPVPELVASQETLPPGALIIEKTLRSGQRVYARGRDLIVLAVCNSGSEIIADGHIHVYATLRGRAIAGARGWTQASVFAQNMQPELISIAGIYLTSDDGLSSEIWGHSARAHLVTDENGDRLIFNPLT